MDKVKVKEIVEDIGSVADLLYQENFSEGYGRLSVLLRKMIAVTAEITDKEEQDAFVAVLQPALDAMEQQDATMLADILLYEIKEKLEEYL